MVLGLARGGSKQTNPPPYNKPQRQGTSTLHFFLSMCFFLETLILHSKPSPKPQTLNPYQRKNDQKDKRPKSREAAAVDDPEEVSECIPCFKLSIPNTIFVVETLLLP